MVEVAFDLRDAECGQRGIAVAHQRRHPPAAHELRQRAAHDVAAADYQQSTHRTIIAWPQLPPSASRSSPAGTASHRRQRHGAASRARRRPDPALRLPQRRLRRLQGQGARRPGGPRPGAGHGAADGGSRRRHDLVLLRQAALDLVLEVREVGTARDIPVKILPCRVQALERAADDVIVMSLKLPVNERLQFLAGQYIEFMLKDGKRRAFSIANAPHDDGFLQLHIRQIPGRRIHRACLRRHEGKGHPALPGPLRQLLPARGVEEADDPGRRRHRFRADQVAGRARDSQPDRTAAGNLLGCARPRRALPA
jgi:hypothetical protein